MKTTTALISVLSGGPERREKRIGLDERDRSGSWTVQSDTRTVSSDVGTLPGEKSRLQQHANAQEAST